jgi:hypothetical protein
MAKSDPVVDTTVVPPTPPPPTKTSETAPAAKVPFEQLALQAGTADWLLAATKHHHKWCVGQLVTLDEFNAALEQTLNATGAPKEGLNAT